MDSTNRTNTPRIYVGCAGWSIPKEQASQFAASDNDRSDSAGSHLERYSLRLPAAEINSSFYRAHRPATYARWAASVPEQFRFSVKLPRQLTHVQRLHAPEEVLTRFLSEVEALGAKLGPILVQMPPSLSFEEKVASAFFDAMRDRFHGQVVCEPRHAGWFQPDAERTLRQFEIARVAADPAVPLSDAAHPSGWKGIAYYRLHGSPRTYYSAYPNDYLAALAQNLTHRLLTNAESPASAPDSTPETIWCIFDNTALGAATANALSLLERLRFSTR